MRKRTLINLTLILSLWIGLIPLAFASTSATQVGHFIVMFKEQPDASKAAMITDLSARRRAIYQIARDTASRTQGPTLSILRNELTAGRVQEVTPLIIVNAVAFKGQRSVADTLSLRPEVQNVSTDEIVRAPFMDSPAESLYNIDKVRVRDAWAAGFSGQGAVIGSIDTGADSAHEALKTKYRGYSDTGTVNDYNWFDPIGLTPSPEDPSGHGTHTLGTALGGNGPVPSTPGAVPSIGVAYGSKWIAARAFDSAGQGLTSTVLLAMQWMQFPTPTSTGEPGAPKPELAPDIVTNSWSTDGNCRAWFAVALRMWREANILPVFSAGDGGSAVHSPADLAHALAVGATDRDDVRPTFSGLGPSACTVPSSIKPDIHAPGVGIYSSLPSSEQYGFKSGTSMAAPLVAGAAALMIEASGGRGNLEARSKDIDREIKASTDACVSGTNYSCGRLNVYEAVRRVARTGELTGMVKDAETELPIAGAKVNAVRSGATSAITAVTGPDGRYSMRLIEGSYMVTGTAYGYIRSSVPGVSIAESVQATANFTLERAPLRTISGRVTFAESGDPAVGAVVKLLDTPLATTTGSDGTYSISGVPDPSVPDSSDPNDYDYVIQFGGKRCYLDQSSFVSIKDPPSTSTASAALLTRHDSFGYSCEEVPLTWVGGINQLPLEGDDVVKAVQLPFAVPFYEHRVVGPDSRESTSPFTTAYISDNGVIRFDVGGIEYYNTPPPSPAPPNAAIYAFWDDLRMDDLSGVFVASTEDSYTVEWRQMTFHYPNTGRITFSATLHRNGDVEMRYKDVSGFGAGLSATIGLENSAGSIGFTYSHNESVVTAGLALSFSAATQPSILTGRVTDQASGQPLQTATVSARDSNSIPRTTTTDPNGTYRLRLQAASYSVTASKFHYRDLTKTTILSLGQSTLLDFGLERTNGFTVTGTVSDSATGAAIPNVPVSLGDSNIPVVQTSSTGIFTFSDVPPGSYSLQTAGSGRCRPNSVPVAVSVSSGDVSQDIQLGRRVDAFGYSCSDFDPSGWISADTPIAIGQGAALVSLPFGFPLYGRLSSEAYVSLNGHVTFERPSSASENGRIPSATEPNSAIYAFWDQLLMDPQSQILTRLGSNFAVIEWRNMVVASDPGSRVTFEIILYSNGNFEIQYLVVGTGIAGRGGEATVGSENATGTDAFEYSNNAPVLRDGLKISFLSPLAPGGGGGSGQTGLTGRVTDSTTSMPLSDVYITIGNGSVTQTAITDFDGRYDFPLSSGNYHLYAQRTGYRSFDQPVTVLSTQPTILDLQMQSLPLHTIAGVVRDQDLRPLPGFDFKIITEQGTEIPIKADGTGYYALTLSEGAYTFEVSGSGRCQHPLSINVLLDRDISDFDLNLTLERDAFGYTCIERNIGRFQGLIPVNAADGSVIPVVLPFEFQVYSTRSRIAYVDTKGSVTFDNGSVLSGPVGPSLKVFADPDLIFDASSKILVWVDGPFDAVIEWRDLLLAGERITFAVQLHSTGEIDFEYPGGESDRTTGSNATIGIFDSCSNRSFVYSSNLPGAVHPGLGIYFGKRFASIGSSSC